MTETDRQLKHDNENKENNIFVPKDTDDKPTKRIENYILKKPLILQTKTHFEMFKWRLPPSNDVVRIFLC